MEQPTHHRWLVWLGRVGLLGFVLLGVLPRACELYNTTLARAPLLVIHNRSTEPISFRVESTPVGVDEQASVRGAGVVVPGVPTLVRHLRGDRLVCWGEETGAVSTNIGLDRFAYVSATEGVLRVITEFVPLPEPKPAGSP